MYGESSWYSLGSLPKNTTLTELRSPDTIPSFSRLKTDGRGKDIVMAMEIKDVTGRRLGALVLVGRGKKDDGRLDTHGVALFTDEEIRSCQE